MEVGRRSQARPVEAYRIVLDDLYSASWDLQRGGKTLSISLILYGIRQNLQLKSSLHLHLYTCHSSASLASPAQNTLYEGKEREGRTDACLGGVVYRCQEGSPGCRQAASRLRSACICSVALKLACSQYTTLRKWHRPDMDDHIHWDYCTAARLVLCGKSVKHRLKGLSGFDRLPVHISPWWAVLARSA